MPLFVGSVGYFGEAPTPLPSPPTLPFRKCRACREGAAAAAVGETTRDAGADVGADVSRQLAGAGALVARWLPRRPPRAAAFASFFGDARAPGGVSGGGANASVGRCGRSSFSIAIFRANCTLSRRPFSALPESTGPSGPSAAAASDTDAASSSTSGSRAGFFSGKRTRSPSKSCNALGPITRLGALAFDLGRSIAFPFSSTSSGVARQSQLSTPTTFPVATSRTNGTSDSPEYVVPQPVTRASSLPVPRLKIAIGGTLFVPTSAHASPTSSATQLTVPSPPAATKRKSSRPRCAATSATSFAISASRRRKNSSR